MSGQPFANPTCHYVDLGGSTRVLCCVPGCDWQTTEDTRHRAQRLAAEHRREHRTALRSGGGSGQMTVYDALDQEGTQP